MPAWMRSPGFASAGRRTCSTSRPTMADLAALLKLLPDGVPVTIVGIGSNLLVRDGGIPGVVIRLSAKKVSARFR